MARKGSGRRTAPFISTQVKDGRYVVQLHQDGQGKPQVFLLDPLPRTLLSTATAGDGPTVALARKEMRSSAKDWGAVNSRVLAVEPDRTPAYTLAGRPQYFSALERDLARID